MMGRSIARAVELLVVVIVFFSVAYVTGRVLGLLFPSLLTLDPWSILEALVALVSFGSFVMGAFLYKDKKSIIRMHFLRTTISRNWLVGIFFIILLGIAILGVLIAGSEVLDYTLRHIYWGSWVLCLVIAMFSGFYIVYLHVKK